MEWAEELKMSIKKTARKGRRSKSRDVLKGGDAPQTSSSVTSKSIDNLSASSNAHLSIDITLDQSTLSPSTSSPSNAGVAAAEIGNATKSKRPAVLRRISGGWADTSIGKSLKSKKNSFDDDRFGSSKPSVSPNEDAIPTIPDLDDVKDDLLLNEIAEPPAVTGGRLISLNELNAELLSQHAFSAVQKINLQILTKCLKAPQELDEPDDVWEWEKLFTDVVAEINNDKQQSLDLDNRIQKIDINRDDEMSIMHAKIEA